MEPITAIRRATEEDLDFLVGAVIAAEESGQSFTSYERVFDLSRQELTSVVRALMAEGVPGTELSCESFRIALGDDGARAGCVATWIEADDGPPSHLQRAAALSYALGAARWSAAQARLRTLAVIDIERAAGALQIEGVYTAHAWRGRGVAPALIAHALAAPTGATKAQILSASGNEASRRAFAAAGFVTTRTTSTNDPAVRALFPGPGRVLWERALP